MTSIFRDGRGYVPTTIFVPNMSSTLGLWDTVSHELVKGKGEENVVFSLPYGSQKITDADLPFLSNFETKQTVSDVYNPYNTPRTDYEKNELRLAAREAFQRIFKKKDSGSDTKIASTDSEISDVDVPSENKTVQDKNEKNIEQENQTVYDSFYYSELEKSFDILAEKRLRRQADKEYEAFVERREAKIKAEQERLKELDEYNQELAKKALEKKLNAERKKRARRELLALWAGILAGDKDDPSIPKPILGILSAYLPGFVRIWRFHLNRILPISPISPVSFGSSGLVYRREPEISINCKIDPYRPKIFAGVYRRWCEQFVRRIIEKRTRGPPSLTI